MENIDLLVATLAFAGSLGGASVAFALEALRRRLEERSKRVTACNRVMITLATQHDQLDAIYRQSMKPYVDHPVRYVAMPPVLPLGAHAPRLDIESLVFLLETDDRKLVRELMVEQDRYDLALQAVNQRSKVHHDIAQPRLAAANVKEHSVIPREELEEVLGPTLVIELRRATDHAFEHIEGARKSTHDVAKRFSATMRKRFGKKVVYLGLRELDRSAD